VLAAAWAKLSNEETQELELITEYENVFATATVSIMEMPDRFSNPRGGSP
jgi:hypothetical protein